jgi:rare lipoprotein A
MAGNLFRRHPSGPWLRRISLACVLAMSATTMPEAALRVPVGPAVPVADTPEFPAPVRPAKVVPAKFVPAKFVTASWYGPHHHGRPTASGEVFDAAGFTAAHRTLPFGTRLLVTNPENGRTVEVRVNDRGPYVAGRSLDLSEGAALAIGIHAKGTGTIEIRQAPSPQ